MEIGKRQPKIATKIWNIVRIAMYMMRRSKVKRKIMVELNTLVNKGKKGAKAILDHHHHYSCRSNDTANTAFVSARDYEFSCSNTPVPKRKNRHNHQYDNDLKVMHKAFGILSRYDIVEASPFHGGVDKDAEEFINKFYRELKKQRPAETPSPYREWTT
ncbi:uncharacterized protein LOC125212625 [Salvia hispanica]|uniref:uncharacterized protein LOC125212625 n=1 Tax=Salvia hispanica TaxID=49212 RepID=UPI002008F3AD|nr:uncharacterized protein LOC125212625 [Salvia hispanica]